MYVTLIDRSVTGEAELRLDVPDSITTWVTEAIGLSAEKGLGLAQITELRTFKPFFIDFTLPYSVVRGEQTKVPLTVYNYLPTCAEVCACAFTQKNTSTFATILKGSFTFYFVLFCEVDLCYQDFYFKKTSEFRSNRLLSVLFLPPHLNALFE